MDEPRDQAPAAPEPTESPGPQLVGRRRLLKILAAGGGAVVASTLLPDTWSAPAVKAAPTPGDGGLLLTGLHVSGSMAGFDYIDPPAEVDDDHTFLYTQIDSEDDGWKSLRDRAVAGLQRYGNAGNGSIRFPLWTTGNWSTHRVCVQLWIAANSPGRYSNYLCAPFSVNATPTVVPPPAAAPCARADVSAIIYGGWNGILVDASVGGVPQPAMATALDAWGRPAVLWTVYPPEGKSWTVVVTPRLPAGLDPARWKFEPASASVTVTGCSEAQVTFQLIDTGANSQS